MNGIAFILRDRQQAHRVARLLTGLLLAAGLAASAPGSIDARASSDPQLSS